MPPSTASNHYVDKMIERRNDRPIGRDSIQPEWCGRQSGQRQAGCGMALLVVFVMFVLAVFASTPGSVTLALTR